jgi:hypothetical protein
MKMTGHWSFDTDVHSDQILLDNERLLNRLGPRRIRRFVVYVSC